jgi:hypothetical protein
MKVRLISMYMIVYKEKSGEEAQIYGKTQKSPKLLIYLSNAKLAVNARLLRSVLSSILAFM